MIDYIIYAPDFVANSAGVRALYILADRLNSCGYKTYITGSQQTQSALNAPLIPRFLARIALRTTDAVVVYPETITGNPLGARFVARWVLNRPGLLAGEEIYEHNEMVFSYSDVYSGYIKNSILGKLHLPTIDQKLFFDDHVPESDRTLECFYIGKSTFKYGYCDRNLAFEITRESPPKEQLGKLFRAARVLYCFDNSTILAFEAALCGCPVVIIPDGTQTRADFEKLELGMSGIAWGLDDLPRAKATLPELSARYEASRKTFDEQLLRFIEITSQRRAQIPKLDTAQALASRSNLDGIDSETVDAFLNEVNSLEAFRYFQFQRQFRLRFPRLYFVTEMLSRLFFRLAIIFKTKVLDRAKKRTSSKVFELRRQNRDVIP